MNKKYAMVILTALAVGLVVTGGCGNKADDAASSGSTTTPAAATNPANVPTTATQAGQGATQMGNDRAKEAASNAAAFAAAREKAERGGK